MRTLLRRIMGVMDPFFWSFKALQLNDAVATYNQISERLSDRKTAVLLEDDEYEAMDATLTRFGQMVALSQRHCADEEEKATENPAAAEHNASRRGDELRLFLAQAFRDAMIPLEQAIQSLGDDGLRAQYEELRTRADEFIKRQEEIVSRI